MVDKPHTPDLRDATTAELSALLGSPPALALTSSCTHALEAAAQLLDIGPGHEVIVPAFTFPSSANPFLIRGATLRFADIDPYTGNVDATSVAARTTPRTAAVVCMHYGGVAGPVDELVELGRSDGWSLVEDAAHGLFGTWDGRPLGTFGRLGAVSFHRTKNISAHEGGALIVNDPELVDRVDVALDKGTDRARFEAGEIPAYDWVGIGSSWRMSDPHVELLAASLSQREAIQRRRHEIWQSYRSGLSSWAERTGSRLPHIDERAEHPAHLFWISLGDGLDRDRVVEACARAGVPAFRHYSSLPDSPYGQSIRHPEDDCPAASAFAGQLIRLPLHHDLENVAVERAIEVLHELN
jgi:dTDP-4-amino-4,6-dideoxygalactose transaminase